MRLTLLITVILCFLPVPAVALPADVQLRVNTFSTDLPMAESKEPIHRVILTCRLVDGGSCRLTLDPTVPKFDEFGDEVEGVKPAPVVSLNCTLKLTKMGKDWQLFELSGPKLVTRLSLVTYADIRPWGDGRLLVHRKGGEVRYAIDLFMPRPRP